MSQRTQYNFDSVSPSLYQQLQNEKRNLEIVNSNLISKAEANNAVIDRLNQDNIEKSQQIEIMRESLQKADAIIKRLQEDSHKATTSSLMLETQITKLQQENRHLQQANSQITRVEGSNQDLMKQNERLQSKLMEAKVKMDNLRFEKSNMQELNNEKRQMEANSMRESDQVIQELSAALKRRELEMQGALDENSKLMHSFNELEAEYQKQAI